jgi:hypothetical protein
MGCAGSKQGVARASVSPVKVAQALAAPQGTRSEDNNLNGPTTEDARGRATSSASQLSATKTAAETVRMGQYLPFIAAMRTLPFFSAVKHF